MLPYLSYAACTAGSVRTEYRAARSLELRRRSIVEGSRSRREGQGLQMVRTGMLRSQQQKDQIYRLIVQRFKIDWFVQSRKNADDGGNRAIRP